MDESFDHAADVVIVGGGGAGLPAAISARDEGASVIVVEANHDLGGHALLSAGNVRLGGGTRLQKQYGIEDTADQIYRDLTDPQSPQYRRSDRDLVRVFADENVATMEFLFENGLVFEDVPPRPQHGMAARSTPAKVFSDNWNETINMTGGSGVVRPLEASARRKGVSFLLQHKVTKILREQPNYGRVLGVVAIHNGKEVRIGARRGVILATGGHTSNVEFRRVFDARLTEEYQTAGEPWTKQNADAELLAMEVGASLWGVGIQTTDAEREEGGGTALTKTKHIGCRYGYVNLKWDQRSPLFGLVRATGLTVNDFQDVILVNQVGKRFWNEMDDNVAFINACLGPNGNLGKDGRGNGGGPIWAIFDAKAVEREHWVPEPPHVDPDGWFFSANTIAELAKKIANPYQRAPIPAAALEETVQRYNQHVVGGVDPDFGKPTPLDRSVALARAIDKPPFYAAWATPTLHDTLAGLRIDSKCRVVDWYGRVIPGLFCAGEAAGGLGFHGLPRALTFGRIAGREVARSA